MSVEPLKLIGLTDSPFVRRVAIAMNHYGVPFTRVPWSVYRNADQLKAVNPLMTAPTLVLADGTVLIDSNFICDYLDALAGDDKSLMPKAMSSRVKVQQIVARANVACEKVGQLYRELPWRPEGLRHAEAISRFTGQIVTGVEQLEQGIKGEWAVDGRMTYADIMPAITLTFVRYYATTLAIPLAEYPKLEALTARMEATPAFQAVPLD